MYKEDQTLQNILARQKLLDLVQPALELGCRFEVYIEKSSGTFCVDLGTQAKSHCILKLEDEKVMAHRRYGKVSEVESFDELLEVIHDCGHGRDYFNNDWLTVLNHFGVSSPIPS